MSRFADLVVDMETLENLGIDRIHIDDHASDRDLSVLLEDIRLTECDHSWNFFKPHSSINLLQQLKEKENSRRPTHFFFYYAVFKDGSQKIVGAGTVAERIKNSFPFDGFPVLARAIILKEYRDKRFYFPMLKHRLQFCIEYFGTALKAVHMGSSNPRIFKAIRYKVFNIPFVYVGNEILEDNSIVRDFLWLTDGYKRETEMQLLAMNANIDSEMEVGLARLTNSVFRLLANQFDESGFNELCNYFYFLPERFRPKFIGELVAFCEAIPVMKSEYSSDPIFDDPKLPTIRSIPTEKP